MQNWAPVIDLIHGGYFGDFERDREYEFKRAGDDHIARFRLCDQSEFFNVAGLYWRDPELTAADDYSEHLLGAVVDWRGLYGSPAGEEQ